MIETYKKIGFIGAGNMATAIIKGLIESGGCKPEQIFASDKSEEAIERISSLFNINCFTNNDIVHKCDIVILAVKPQKMAEVFQEIKETFRQNQVLISIAAGVSISRIRSLGGPDMPVIRVMPNTPALIQMGISALAKSENVSEEDLATAKKIFDSVGETVEVEEGLMDAITAVSGSGPGYIFRIMESMVAAGVGVGLETDISLRLVIQTFVGAAHLAKESDHSLSVLRQMVTSPGGTTAAGLSTLEKLGLEQMIQRTVTAARDRSLELGKE